MLTRQISVATPIFLLIFLIQEAVISQFRLPGGGFSILMDLSQSANGPFGQWTLIMLLAGYAISYIGYGDDNIHANAIGIVFFVVIANFCVEIAYLITGALLGVSIGSLGQIVITLFGMSIWALLVSPIMLPVFTRLHALIFDSRSSL